MKDHLRRSGFFVLGIFLILLIGCATCGNPYRRELSNNPDLQEANESYRKAMNLIDKAECNPAPAQAKEEYTTAESYLSDAIFKLKQEGHDRNINVSEDIYYCEKIKSETDVKIGQADRAK